jgi:hypothetical protein
MTAKTETLADDILYGANAIAQFTGLSERQVYHQQRNLQLAHLGAMLVGSKTELRKRLTTPAPKKVKEQAAS